MIQFNPQFGGSKEANLKYLEEETLMNVEMFTKLRGKIRRLTVQSVYKLGTTKGLAGDHFIQTQSY